MALEEYFATGPAHEKPIFDAVMAQVATLGPVHVEPVSVGIFLKRAGATFVTLRPMSRWVAAGFSLPRRARHPTVRRQVAQYHGKYYHVANLRSPDEIDPALAGLLTEAYLSSGRPGAG